MAKLKSEKHHWWPQGVSEYWGDQNGGVNWLLPDGTVRRSTPNNFGVIQNGHHIKIAEDPSAYCPWDESFEHEFNNADNNFPALIDWIDTLDRCDPPFDRPINHRIVAQDISDSKFNLLIECVISLAARSPMHRERGVALAEEFHGPLPERKRNGLIGANIRHALRNAVRGVGSRGKFMAIFSPEREFIFGDGFFNNLTVNGEHWHGPKILVPLTPWLSVLFSRPMEFITHPRLTTLVINREEAEQLNYTIQVYSRNAIFYRYDKPDLTDAFTIARHKIFANWRNPVDRLIHEIPGIPPRDTSLDFLEKFLDS